MPAPSVESKAVSPRDVFMLRLSIVVGGILMSLFMIGELQMLPPELADSYVTNRVLIQLPFLAGLLAFTFFPQFLQFAQTAFLVTVLSITYANYYMIHLAWAQAAFSFPYEGTLLYAFFGFFVFGMTFHYALITMLLSTLGFVGLMLLDSIYGTRTWMNVELVAGSLFIGVIGRYRIDQLLEQLEYANAQLVDLSTEDGLTELLNRRALRSESERLFALQRRSNLRLAVFMMDLDHFKQFNDRYGHQKGDWAIRIQADIMRQVFKRQTDILGRYGGEEFMAVIDAEDADRCEWLAAEILKQWRQLALPNEDSPGSNVLSCSIGICQGLASEFDSIDDMIRRADEALYCAKKQGRARYVMA